MNINVDTSWSHFIEMERNKPYFKQLESYVDNKRIETLVFPPEAAVFKAFELCPFHEIKVLILGQDPYHGQGQACGLSFAVPPGVKFPPSLQNIIKEINSDLGGPPSIINLENWAKQGVFLLNSFLTVEEGKPSAHAKIGWDVFTDTVIRYLSEHRKNLVFMLWGAFAKKKIEFIDATKHLILTAGHPSPLSVRHFTGCKHFSKCNTYLETNQLEGINWKTL